jgi:hypothetical protein
MTHDDAIAIFRHFVAYIPPLGIALFALAIIVQIAGVHLVHRRVLRRAGRSPWSFPASRDVKYTWAERLMRAEAPGKLRRIMMLELRPNCECCDRDLPADSAEAFICSFECTFCRDCASSVLKGKCPNCGGELVARPRRPAEKLASDPASTKRIFKPHHGCAKAA